MCHPLVLIIPNIQKYFNFNEKWHCEEIGDVNFKGAIGIWLFATSYSQKFIKPLAAKINCSSILMKIGKINN